MHGVFKLQHITTYFLLDSDEKLKIIFGEFQQRLCTDEWYIDYDCDFNTGVD